MKQGELDNEVIPDDTPQANSSIAPGEIVIGSLVGIDPQGQPLVDFPENPFSTPLTAMSTLSITRQHIDREVALLFANGNPQQPVIMGMIHSPLHAMLETYQVSNSETGTPEKSATATGVDELRVDGKRVVIEGKEEIVLKCGDASITLTKAGKILIRGKYLLNRSEGVNRIMGGSVQVN